MTNDVFKDLIWQKGRELYRTMPWRENTDPYFVLVSELMLQQTQVVRVIPKFDAFIAAFPDVGRLAEASLAEVLTLWQGLGYNRRAKFLHEAARCIVTEYGGVFPETKDDLLKLPGVGENTAGALLAYAFNQPSVFIETNVRTVYFHHFFPEAEQVDDKEIRALVEQTIDHEHPREWYWALMDYGSWLKAQGVRNVAMSRHYKKQSPLKGSVRELRGKIVELLVASSGEMEEGLLMETYGLDDRYGTALNSLKKDGLVTQLAGKIHLTK